MLMPTKGRKEAGMKQSDLSQFTANSILKGFAHPPVPLAL